MRDRKVEVSKATRAQMNARPLAEKWGLTPEEAPEPERFAMEIRPKLQAVVLHDR